MSSNTIPIVFAINNEYAEQLCCVINSISLNSKSKEFEFFVLHSSITNENCDIITKYVKSLNLNINFINMNEICNVSKFESYLSVREGYNYISKETFYRFFIPSILPSYDKVIYLDCDVIVLADLRKLYDINIENTCIGACEDLYIKDLVQKDIKTQNYPTMTFKEYFKEKLKKNTEKYFNAGVLVLNLKRMREKNIEQTLLDFTQNNPPLEFQDQDILNSVLENETTYLDTKWNNFHIEMRKPSIVHYAGLNKPWNMKNIREHWQEYWKYLKNTPYYNVNCEKTYNSYKKAFYSFKIELLNFKLLEIKNDKKAFYLKVLFLKYKKNHKYKVGLIIDEFFGGANTAYGGYGFLARKYIAKYLPDKNIEVDVLLGVGTKRRTAQKFHEDNVNLYRLPRAEKYARKWLKKKNYDLYLSIELTYNYVLANEPNPDKKLVLWIQDPRPKSAWENVINTMESIKDPCFYEQSVYDTVNLWNQNKRIKFISQGNCLNPLAKELYNLPQDTPIQYLPNPIDIDFDYQFDITKKKKQIIFLGRLEAQKRCWLFCEIAKRMPEYEFYVLGQFFRYKEDNERMLKPYMNGDIPNLHFVGHCDGEKKKELMKESRLLLSTAIWEGIPISWLETLSYGTIIVSDLERENLIEKFGSYVGEIPGDGFDKVDNFIPAIKELMENDELYSQKAKAAIEYVRKNHNIEKFQKDLRNVIMKEIVNEGETSES